MTLRISSRKSEVLCNFSLQVLPPRAPRDGEGGQGELPATQSQELGFWAPDFSWWGSHRNGVCLTDLFLTELVIVMGTQPTQIYEEETHRVMRKRTSPGHMSHESLHEMLLG